MNHVIFRDELLEYILIENVFFLDKVDFEMSGNCSNEVNCEYEIKKY
jgi:hypothetical protein